MKLILNGREIEVIRLALLTLLSTNVSDELKREANAIQIKLAIAKAEGSK